MDNIIDSGLYRKSPVLRDFEDVFRLRDAAFDSTVDPENAIDIHHVESKYEWLVSVFMAYPTVLHKNCRLV